MSHSSRAQTLKIVVGSEGGLHFEEEVSEAGTSVSRMRFEDILTTDTLSALISLRMRGFVEGAPDFHAQSMAEGTEPQDD